MRIFVRWGRERGRVQHRNGIGARESGDMVCEKGKAKCTRWVYSYHRSDYQQHNQVLSRRQGPHQETDRQEDEA